LNSERLTSFGTFPAQQEHVGTHYNRKTGPKDRLPFSSIGMHHIPQDIRVLLGDVAQHPRLTSV